METLDYLGLGLSSCETLLESGKLKGATVINFSAGFASQVTMDSNVTFPMTGYSRKVVEVENVLPGWRVLSILNRFV